MKFFATIRNWFFIFTALTAAIFLWLLCVAFYPFGGSRFDQVSDGKKLTAWANEVCLPYYPKLATNYWTPSLHAQNDRAVSAIRKIGTNALPLALELCGTSDSRLKQWLEKITSYDDDAGLVRYRITPEYEKHRLGGNLLLALGPQAEPAIPQLIRLLQSSDDAVAIDLMPVLPQISTNVVPPLLRLLADTNEIVRVRAAIILGRNFELSAAIPALLENLTGSNPYASESRYRTRVEAIQAVGSITSAAPAAVPVLLHQLQNEQSPVLIWSYIKALGNFGTNAEAAVPLLLEMARTSQFDQYQILHALQQINPETAAPLMKKWQEKPASNQP